MALSGWDSSKQLQLTIDGSKVEGDLTDFPVLVTLSSGTGQTGFDTTRVFDELTTVTGTRKIAITDENDNQLYTEIERWDWGNEEANLWVKVPTIASGTDTVLSLYYDSTHDDNIHFVGGIGDLSYQMIVDLGDEGIYDTNHAARPSVIKESDTSYKMWYSGHDTINWRIMYAESSNGTTWSGHSMVLDYNVEGTNDKTGAIYPFVIKESDSSYKMWYGGQDVSYIVRIMYATSTDGISWSVPQMVLNINQELTYDTSHVNAPYVIKESDISYKMWYGGEDGTNWRTLYATSTDGITWTGHTMVIDIGAQGIYDTSRVLVGSVIKESDTSYKMWYGGHDGTNQRIIYTTSTNGTTWSNHQLVINFGVEGTYDTLSSALPYIIEESDSSYKMWYSGQDGSSKWRILYSQYWSTNVWDGNFVGIWHMNQDPSGGADAIKDSTPKVNHGTSAGTMLTGDLVDGKIGKALNFDGGDDYIDLGTGSDLEPGTEAYTWETILKSPDMTARMAFLGKQTQSGDYPGWVIRVSQAGSDRKLHAQLREDNVNRIAVLGETALSDDTEYHCAIAYDGSETAAGISMLLNGVAETEVVETDTGPATAASINEAHIGSAGDVGGNYFAGIIEEVRFSNIERSTAWLKATYYSNWDNFVTFSEFISFTYSNPIPTDLSTVYGTTENLYLTVTVTGIAPSYVYDATFYDAYDSSIINSTVSGVQSGLPAGVAMSTVSGINYQWYVTATSSGIQDTSSTYTFTNKFLCEGQTQISDIPASGVPVRLYRRSTGEYIGGVVSSGVSGTFEIETDYNEYHYAIALYTLDDTNAVIADWLIPSN